MPHWNAKFVVALFAFILACVVSKNLNTPHLSHMTDNAITQGGIKGRAHPLYICQIYIIHDISVHLVSATCLILISVSWFHTHSRT